MFGDGMNPSARDSHPRQRHVVALSLSDFSSVAALSFFRERFDRASTSRLI